MIDFEKHGSLLEEFKTADKLIRLGFGELQNIDGTNDFYFLPFQLLSQGFERTMKAYICAVYYHRHEEYPNYEYIKSLGHDLSKLLNEIIEHYYKRSDRYQFLLDQKLLDDDKEFRELLSIISEFGKFARYHHFDIITGHKNPSINTVKSWTDFESRLIERLEIPAEKIFDPDPKSLNEVYAEIARYIIVKFESFVSALGRQIIFDTAGAYGKQVSSTGLYNFGLLYQDKFGLTDYRTNTASYNEKLKPAVPFTIKNEIDRFLNPNVKYKTIKKEEYQGTWPFYADKVTLQCERKTWCTIIIEGRQYALNGSAKGRYKLENPHDAGLAILGISLGDFITIAREL
ncbi:hypothetical protein [Sphingobacterium yanglingense]|uniref:HEPN domain-containing protein n=1 Tax=Sphingobacterium yanglingense TaxID=1437280 RepID=A0A4R6WR20_9SPHI|nr:hypothetical protein [Sphingobacterium yanglingense]TDQ79076.1 hypothetical protein CLV99_0508 [Sphingobacterium yanglingense]